MSIGEFLEDNGGRKFIFGVVLAVGAFSLAIAGRISFQELLGFVEWIFGLFVVGNVAQKFSSNSGDTDSN